MTARQVLVVDDEIGIRELLRDILQDEGYHVRLAENAAEARESRKMARPDLVLLDIWMPDCDGITLLKEWGSSGALTMPVVMMSGHGTIDTAVEATRIGAFDFLEKPIALQKLLKTVSTALKYGEQLPKSDMSLLNLGKSQVISDLRKRLEQVAQTHSPLLLIGEHGSGAELCAHFLHRPDTPWLVLEDPAKLASAPLEILEPLSDGVLYVPEVANLNKTEQKGLMVLIAKAEKQDTRVVCATAQALPQLVAEGLFDAALFNLLASTSLRVPKLSDHREDIPDLVQAMALLIADGHAQYKEFDVAALNALRNSDWPGNLAQLDGVVRNLVQTSLGEKVTLSDVERVFNQFGDVQPASQQAHLPIDLNLPLREARDAFERLYFEHHIALLGKNMSRLAETVALERTHLYRKLKQLGIKVK